MARSVTIQNLYDKKFKQFAFDGLYKKAMGLPESCGVWLIYGAEKNGKTWWALKLADYLSTFAKVLYISAEEGTGMDFVNACRRAQLQANNRQLHFEEYMPIDDLMEKIESRKSAKVVLLDNCTVYNDELRVKVFRELKYRFPEKLFIFLAHEEKKEPYTALGKIAKKWANIIMHVKGLTVNISGRCPGGIISIDENKAALYWGAEILNN